MNHEAIYKTHPSVLSINESGDGTIVAWDREGNEVTIDIDAVNAESIIVENEWNFRNLRKERNLLLAETDYLALVDNTLTDEMRTYRQALRDLPANTSDPSNPNWPTKPSN